MSNLPDFAKISPEITEMSKDALTKLGFQLTKSTEEQIFFKKHKLSIILSKPEIYDSVRILFRFDNLDDYLNTILFFGPELEYYLTNDYPITKRIRQQCELLRSSEKNPFWDDPAYRERICVIIIRNLLDMVKQFLPELEQNFDPEKYLSWRKDNRQMLSEL